MSRLSNIYNENRNGIIVTLMFHILLFLVLNLSQFKKKQTYIEAEMIIDFPEELPEASIQEQQAVKELNHSNNQSRTNIASNKALNNEQTSLDRELQEELAKAQKLVENVTNQLKKEIPTIDDLEMPEDIREEQNSDSILNKIYSGDSNIEYFLQNRYHLRLPIPVYLSQYAGQVRVNITVNHRGKVTKAEPVINNKLNEQVLSYAKTAALRTRFNSIKEKQNQSGYILYNFEAQ